MEIVVDTIVQHATVFPDRARVVCRGNCDLPEGAHRIIIPDLPLALEPESVRVAGKGSAQVTVRGVDVVRRHYSDSPSTAVLNLERDIRQIEDQLHSLEDQQAVRQASLDHLQGLRAATNEYAWGLARGRHTTENQAALMRFFEAEDDRLRLELRDLAAKQRALRDELDKLKRELAELRSALPRQRYEARIEVEAKQAGIFEPEISYVVTNAGWQPLYDIRLVETAIRNGNDAQVFFQKIAEVYQNTGQPWPQIEMTVSTARPALNQVVPELKPWYIDIPHPQPRPLRGMAKAYMERNTMELASDDDMPMLAAAPGVEMMAADVEVADVMESGSTVVFRVSGHIDIPGDGSPHKTTLSQNELSPRLDYLTIPRLANAVYRRARLENMTSAPILPGPANLYVGDEYIGRNHLKYTPPAAELDLILGVEERIAVKRELVRRDVDKKLLRDLRQVAFAYEIEVENLLKTAVKVTVRDQYPLSRNEQIKVRLDSVSPAPVEQNDLHILEWQLAMEPGQKQKIRFEYQIEHPIDIQVTGLID